MRRAFAHPVFDGPALPPDWLPLRTPRESWIDLAGTRGSLTQRARPVELSSRGQPSFVGRRQQHHLLLSVTLAGGQRVVRLERRGAAGTPVFLRIDARGGRYDFHHGETQGAWTLLQGDVDGSMLSTRVAGGSVGTMLGRFAFAAP